MFNFFGCLGINWQALKFRRISKFIAFWNFFYYINLNSEIFIIYISKFFTRRVRYGSVGQLNGSPRESPMPSARQPFNNVVSVIPPAPLSSRSRPTNRVSYYGPPSSSNSGAGSSGVSPRDQEDQLQSRQYPMGSSQRTQTPQWRSKLSNIKNSLMGTPRFHRRKSSMSKII